MIDHRLKGLVFDWSASVIACKALLKEQPGRLRSSLKMISRLTCPPVGQ
jgi:hypothetical protein